MKVIVKNCYLVKPSEPTWNGILQLSELDQTGTMIHESIVYFYSPLEPQLDSQDSLIETLKTSLGKTLVHFYPLAGRLTWTNGSHLELKCNANGVLLQEAECDVLLCDLKGFSSSPEFHRLIPTIDYATPIEEMPLFAAQLTKFQCGGVSLCFALSHVVADGQGSLHFLFEWARFARGKTLNSTPYFDRKVLRAGNAPGKGPLFNHKQYSLPPLILGQSSSEGESAKETQECIMRLSKSQIRALQTAANDEKEDEKTRAYTRYEVITAHFWRCATKARNHKAQQPTSLCFCVDFRKRMDPPLPDSYFGNAIIDVVASGISGDIISKPLKYVAGKIREAIDSVTPEYVNSAIDFLKDQKDLSKFQELHKIRSQESLPFYGNPNLCVISWMSLPLKGLDFGWGEEIHVTRGTQRCDGDAVIQPDHKADGSLLIDMCLQADHIEDFKKVFYEDINNLSI